MRRERLAALLRDRPQVRIRDRCTILARHVFSSREADERVSDLLRFFGIDAARLPMRLQASRPARGWVRDAMLGEPVVPRQQPASGGRRRSGKPRGMAGVR